MTLLAEQLVRRAETSSPTSPAGRHQSLRPDGNGNLTEQNAPSREAFLEFQTLEVEMIASAICIKAPWPEAYLPLVPNASRSTLTSNLSIALLNENPAIAQEILRHTNTSTMIAHWVNLPEATSRNLLIRYHNLPQLTVN